MNDLKNTILAEIKKGHLSQKARARFYAEWVLLSALGIIAVLASVFLVQYMLFSIHINASEELLRFGPRGWSAFFNMFPWHLLLIDMLAISGLLSLLRQYSFGYRTPLLYLAGVTLFLVIVGGFLADKAMPLERQFGKRGERMEGSFKPFKPGAPKKGSGVCRCEVVAIEEGVLVVRDVHDEMRTLRVRAVPGSRASTTDVAVGDIVMIAGDEKADGTVDAYGIRIREE